MWILDSYNAWSLPPRARRVALVLVVIIVLIVSGVSLMGHGRAALIMVAMAMLTVVVEELARTTLRHWLRTA